VAHPRDRLLDDRSRVELLGHVVGGRADQLHATLPRLLVGPGTRERRQERVVDVDDRDGKLPEQLTGQDLHVAGEHDGVAATTDQLQQLAFRLWLGLGRHGYVVEVDPEGLDVPSGVGVVGHDALDRGVELAPPGSPQQVEEAMIESGHHDHEPFGLTRILDPPVHVERPVDLLEAVAQLVEAAPLGGELHAQEELAATRVRGVLIGVDDVGARLVEVARDRGDDPGPVGARDEEPVDVHVSSSSCRHVSVRSISLNVLMCQPAMPSSWPSRSVSSSIRPSGR
jgi:hypothetical protein